MLSCSTSRQYHTYTNLLRASSSDQGVFVAAKTITVFDFEPAPPAAAGAAAAAAPSPPPPPPPPPPSSPFPFAESCCSSEDVPASPPPVPPPSAVTPSICTMSSVLTLRLASCSPSPPREPARESISSKNIVLFIFRLFVSGRGRGGAGGRGGEGQAEVSERRGRGGMGGGGDTSVFVLFCCSFLAFCTSFVYYVGSL